MKIQDSLQEIINKQIKEEFQSAFIYLTMSAYFASKDLSGFSHWMMKQYNEEIEHAMKMYKYLYERDGDAVIPAIEKVEASWNTPLEAFEIAYKHEQHITACIYKIVELARKEGDLASDNFYQYFVKEQVEEEDAALEIVKLLKKAGDNQQMLFFIDKQLGER